MRGRTSKTFFVHSPRSLLGKLAWEVSALKGTRQDDLNVLSYRALNCAMTAWHMCDWVAVACEESRQTRELLANIAHHKIGHVGDVQRWARAERSIAICEQLAVAAKHVRVDRRPDDSVGTEYLHRRSVADDGPRLVVFDGDKEYRAYEVFGEAQRFWTLALGWLELS